MSGSNYQFVYYVLPTTNNLTSAADQHEVSLCIGSRNLNPVLTLPEIGGKLPLFISGNASQETNSTISADQPGASLSESENTGLVAIVGDLEKISY